MHQQITIGTILWVLGMSVFVILFWLAIDTLPSVVAEIRFERKLKKTRALVEESRRRYEEARFDEWRESEGEITQALRVVRSMPSTVVPIRGGAHRRAKI
jgi:hypothetical protein